MPNTQEYKLMAPHEDDLKRKQEIMLKSLEGNIFPVLYESMDKPTNP